ncbi:MAG: DUF4437 domain-containing protein, partial [Hyphomicrobiales bacterium]
MRGFKPNQTIIRVAAAALLSLLGASGVALAEGPTWDPLKPVAKPSGEVEYKNVNEAIQMADVWGDRTTGPHGTFGKFPANFDTPLHTHTFAYHGVVLAGVMTNPFGKTLEKSPPKLKAGSYWYVPAGLPHATSCVSDT